MRRAPGLQGAPDGQQAKNSCYKMFILPVNAALPIADGFTHISGHPSAAGRAQDRESSPARDRRSITVRATPPTFRMSPLNLDCAWLKLGNYQLLSRVYGCRTQLGSCEQTFRLTCVR